jgi:hypothetical protein
MQGQSMALSLTIVDMAFLTQAFQGKLRGETRKSGYMSFS